MDRVNVEMFSYRVYCIEGGGSTYWAFVKLEISMT